ncbi:glycosyltransferase [Candidatus Soleaferrea massiliensis]|uniref:glycosyltransferase n=1 Tax=Candidatus Soleaferrea massiliensis TaxID=1470354 RepID=UPI00058EFD32|nr:glycosyltransferase [Candidatus Soleaferrea massiliensis]
MKRVCIVIPSMGVGGAQKLVLQLARYLDRERFDLQILCLSGRTGGPFEEALDQTGIPAAYLGKRPGPDVRLLLSLCGMLKSMKPDVLHTHLHAVPYLLPAVLAARPKLRLHTVHSMAQKEAAGPLRLIMHMAYRLFGFRPVAVGRDVSESIGRLYRLPPKDVVCIPNGVEINALHRVERETDKRSSPVRLVTVGALYGPKNHLMLLDAFELACARRCDLTLTILGEGVLRPNLEARIQSGGLASKVFLPSIVRDVGAALTRSDLFVLSSNYEGMPFCVLEAMACGLPVVSTDVGGVSQLVQEGKNGRLVPVGDAKALADAILSLDCRTRRRMGKASRSIVSGYDIRKTVRAYEKLYEEGTA